MRLRTNWYQADEGKHFILTGKGQQECASYRHKNIGDSIGEEAPVWAIGKKYVEEVGIPGWTTLTGYQVVYYNNGYRLPAGNPQTFPTRRAAEKYKEHYVSYPWNNNVLFVEEVAYEGVPLSESKMYNGKEVIDEEHYFGLDCCEAGDYFTEEMVDYFMNLLPPVCMRADCSQIGEPISSRVDENGKSRNTYATFKKIDEGIWEYCGDCFKGENVRHGKEIPYIREGQYV